MAKKALVFSCADTHLQFLMYPFLYLLRDIIVHLFTHILIGLDQETNDSSDNNIGRVQHSFTAMTEVMMKRGSFSLPLLQRPVLCQVGSDHSISGDTHRTGTEEEMGENN